MLNTQNIAGEIRRIPITIPGSGSDASDLATLLKAGDGANNLLSADDLARVLEVTVVGASDTFEVGDSVALVTANVIETYATTASYSEPVDGAGLATEFMRAAGVTAVTATAKCLLARQSVRND